MSLIHASSDATLDDLSKRPGGQASDRLRSNPHTRLVRQ
jgi:hypothetical protein